MTIHATRRGRLMLAAIGAAAVVIAAVVIAVVAFAGPGRPAGRAFPPLRPAAAPASWRQLTLPSGTAVLSYPPALRAITGDKDAVSAARLSPGGAFQLYLNATPRQGSERLAHWAAFRLHLLRSDDAASAHQVAAAQGISSAAVPDPASWTATSRGSARHHFQEIACLVQGHTSASVVVAAAPAASGPRPARCCSARWPPTSSADHP